MDGHVSGTHAILIICWLGRGINLNLPLIVDFLMVIELVFGFLSQDSNLKAMSSLPQIIWLPFPPPSVPLTHS